MIDTEEAKQSGRAMTDEELKDFYIRNIPISKDNARTTYLPLPVMIGTVVFSPTPDSQIEICSTAGGTVDNYDTYLNGIIRLARAAGHHIPEGEYDLETAQIFFTDEAGIEEVRYSFRNKNKKKDYARSTELPRIEIADDRRITIHPDDRKRCHCSIMVFTNPIPEATEQARLLLYVICENLGPKQWEAFYEMRGAGETKPHLLSNAPYTTPPYITTPNPLIYNKLMRAYETKGFAASKDSPWPRHNVDSHNLSVRVELRPAGVSEEDDMSLDAASSALFASKMNEHIQKMGDETADVFDALSYVWLDTVKSEESFAWISTHDILKMRGLMPKKGGCGTRGGYPAERHKEVRRQINILESTWIKVFEMEVIEEKEGKQGKYSRPSRVHDIECRAVVVDSRVGQKTLSGSIEPSCYRFKLGSAFAHYLFGPGRQTALLSAKVLGYDPYREQWEKRLGRYLAGQWRIRQAKADYLKPYSVDTILKEGTKTEIEQKNPNRTKDRLEGALNRLKADGIISAWQYNESWNEDAVGGRGWWKDWLNANISIEPPAAIMEHYKNISLHGKETKALPAPQSDDKIDIVAERKRRGLSIMQAAEEIGISKGSLSQAERGIRTGKKTASKIERWVTKK